MLFDEKIAVNMDVSYKYTVGTSMDKTNINVNDIDERFNERGKRINKLQHDLREIDAKVARWVGVAASRFVIVTLCA